MDHRQLIDDYLAGPKMLRAAVAGMTADEINATPIPGKWSTRQVVCHIADFELVYADRIKRVIAEEEPKLMSGDPDVFAPRLAYGQREIEEELDFIEITRRHVSRILRTIQPQDFQRRGVHSTDGPLTLETLLDRVVKHIPHHVRFIQEKRAALA
jgi:hypothetical protein